MPFCYRKRNIGSEKPLSFCKYRKGGGLCQVMVLCCFTRLLYFTVAPPARKNHSNHFPDKMCESEGHNTRHPNGTGQFPVALKSPDSPHNTSDNCRAPPQYRCRSLCRLPGNQCQTFQGMWQSDRIRHLPRGSEGPTEYTCTAEGSGYVFPGERPVRHPTVRTVRADLPHNHRK